MVKIKNHKIAFMALVSLFILFSVYWITLIITDNTGDKIFGSTYGIIALTAGVFGLLAAKNWGGFHSYFGKAIIFLSLGLLLAEFGQLAFTYLSIVTDEIPYPSLADIGFFGSVPMYILGAFYLMKGLSIGAMIRKTPFKLVLGILIPLLILSISYWVFLKGYETAGLNALTVALDFGYPLGQAIYVSLALVILLSLGRMLGGVMKKPVLLLLFAFILQYVADFNFLYQSHRGTWANGGYGDYLYLLAYFAMGMSLVFLSRSLAKVFTRDVSSGGD